MTREARKPCAHPVSVPFTRSGAPVGPGARAGFGARAGSSPVPDPPSTRFEVPAAHGAGAGRFSVVVSSAALDAGAGLACRVRCLCRALTRSHRRFSFSVPHWIRLPCPARPIGPALCARGRIARLCASPGPGAIRYACRIRRRGFGFGASVGGHDIWFDPWAAPVSAPIRQHRSFPVPALAPRLLSGSGITHVTPQKPAIRPIGRFFLGNSRHPTAFSGLLPGPHTLTSLFLPVKIAVTVKNVAFAARISVKACYLAKRMELLARFFARSLARVRPQYPVFPG